MSLSRSLGSLVVRIAAEGIGAYKSDLNAAADATTQAAGKMETSANRATTAAKNMGGGMGPAAQGAIALGSAAGPAGLVVAALAVVVSAAGVAAYNASKEKQAYAKSLILTGNAAGVTTGQLADMAKGISSSVGTTGQAAAALAAMAGSGAVAGGSLQKFSQVAVEMERTVGTKVADTVSQFAELGNAPVAASLKLNQSMNYLTASTFAQIKAAEDLGDKTTAGALAQTAYADALDSASTRIKANLGTLEKLWKGLKDTATGAWDAMLGLGREQSAGDKLADVDKQLGMLRAKRSNGFDSNGGGAAFGGASTASSAKLERDIGLLEVQRAALQENVKLSQRSATLQAEKAATEKAGIAGVMAVTAANTKALDKQEQMNRALVDYSKSLAAIKAADPTSKLLKPDLIAKTEAAIRAQFADKGGRAAAFNDEANAKIEALKRAQGLEELLAKQSVDRVTSEHRRGMVTDIDFINQVAATEMRAMSGSITAFEAEKVIAATKKNSKKEIAAIDGMIAAAKEKINGRELQQGYAVLELEAKIAAARQAFYNTADHANIAQLDALRDKNKAMRDELEEIGLTATQLFNLTLKRQEDTIAAQAQKVAAMQVFGNGESAAAIQLEIDKLTELTTARNLSINLQDKKDLSIELKGYDATAAQLESLANITGKMGDGFKKATAALGGFATAFKTLSNAEKNKKLTTDELTAAQVGGYAEMAGAAKSFFEENSAGYEIMQAAEQGFRAFELAMSIQSMVQKTVEAGTKVAANGTIAASGVMAGAGEMFASLGPFGFPAVAAMLAVMASLGFGGGGSSASFGTAGQGNQIGADGRKAGPSAADDMNTGTNYNSATGRYDLNNKPQKTEQEMIDFANAAAIDAAANALNNLKVEAMKLTKGSEELEKSLMRATIAAGGAGKAQHALATQGMNEAELASYNYNQALRGQISVQMDIANGTEITTANMKKLAGESRQLAIDILMASGDIAAARAMQRDDATAGLNKEEVAAYDYVQAQKAQLEAINAGASAAREAEQAENTLAQTRWNIAGKLNVLLGRTTQLEFDRATALAATSDEASLAMLKLTYSLEDMYSAVDKNFAVLERSVAAEKKALDETYAVEKKVIDLRLKGSQDLASALKTAKDAISPALNRATAQSQLSMYLALAKAGGVLPTAAALKPALDAIAKPSEELFKTFEDYAIDQAITANDISDLAGFADAQVSKDEAALALMESSLTAAKAQLDATFNTAKAQLDALKGIDTSVTNVANAVLNFEASMMALSGAQTTAAAFSYAAPAAASSYGGGGGGGGYSGGGASSAASATAGMDKDIVAAFNTYYGRDPDKSGYDHFISLGLQGDAMMQAILKASIANKSGADYNYALAHGYDPENPLGNYYHGTGTYKATAPVVESYDVGSNYIERDQIAQIHQGEEITPRAYVDMQRASRDETNALMARLVASNERLEAKVAELNAAAISNANHNSKTASLLDDVINGGRSISTTSEVSV